MGGHQSSLSALRVRPSQPQPVLLTNLWPQVGIPAVVPAWRSCLTLCSSSCAGPKASHLESPSVLLRATGGLGIRPALPCMWEVLFGQTEAGHPTEGSSAGACHQSACRLGRLRGCVRWCWDSVPPSVGSPLLSAGFPSMWCMLGVTALRTPRDCQSFQLREAFCPEGKWLTSACTRG